MHYKYPLHLRMLLIVTMTVLLSGFLFFDLSDAQVQPKWKIHDPARPLPVVVTPALQEAPAPPPSDAIVLFDGTDLSKWRNEFGGPASWTVKDGVFTPSGKGEDICTLQTFSDLQMHVEWSTPIPAKGQGQGRGNSGIYFMQVYEIQILDSFENTTYADGQAAAIYGQHPPLVNASLPPGKWQTYDIVFRAPRFTPDGALIRPAKITAFHNGVLVQDSAAFWGPTQWLQYIPYKPHPGKLPISIQDHGNPLKFRNIWVRNLRESEPPGPGEYETPKVIALRAEELRKYEGVYKYSPNSSSSYVIKSDGRQLRCTLGKNPTTIDLVPHTLNKFSLRFTAAHVEFALDDKGFATAMTMHIPGSVFTVKKVK